jgi:AbrB family looped-hinge helix DNA binding protein
MSETTLTSKGQMTLPKDIRDRLGLQPGQRLTVTLMQDGTVQLRVKDRSILDLAGRLRREGQPTVDVGDLSR